MRLVCRCIFYIMVLLKFHTICLYAKLIMCTLLIIFMFIIFRFKVMALFSPLVAILNQNKLTRSNYVDWKRNLDIVLTAEKHKYVLTQPCPNFPSLDAPLKEKQRYDRWQKSNEMAKCYILAFISNVLQH